MRSKPQQWKSVIAVRNFMQSAAHWVHERYCIGCLIYIVACLPPLGGEISLVYVYRPTSDLLKCWGRFTILQDMCKCSNNTYVGSTHFIGPYLTSYSSIWLCAYTKKQRCPVLILDFWQHSITWYHWYDRHLWKCFDSQISLNIRYFWWII